MVAPGDRGRTWTILGSGPNRVRAVQNGSRPGGAAAFGRGRGRTGGLCPGTLHKRRLLSSAGCRSSEKRLRAGRVRGRDGHQNVTNGQADQVVRPTRAVRRPLGTAALHERLLAFRYGLLTRARRVDVARPGRIGPRHRHPAGSVYPGGAIRGPPFSYEVEGRSATESSESRVQSSFMRQRGAGRPPSRPARCPPRRNHPLRGRVPGRREGTRVVMCTRTWRGERACGWGLGRLEPSGRRRRTNARSRLAPREEHRPW